MQPSAQLSASPWPHRWAVLLANKMFFGYESKLQSGIDELARQITAHLRNAG